MFLHFLMSTTGHFGLPISVSCKRHCIVLTVAILTEAYSDLRRHIRHRAKRLETPGRFVADQSELNYRQRALLQKAIHQPKQAFSVHGHAKSHGTHHNTARTDLRALVKLGYLREKRIGKAKHYMASKRLLENSATK